MRHEAHVPDALSDATSLDRGAGDAAGGTTPRRRRAPRASSAGAALALALPLLGGCQSPGEADAAEGVPFTPPEAPDPDSIGYFLAQYDKSLQRWTELKLNPSGPRDLRTLHALETSLSTRAAERRDELVQVLETGPSLNREVAAVALGFSDDPSVLSPLLRALSDPSPNVVQKALLGLGVLGLEETPLAQITYILVQDPDPWTRNNAAYALTRIVSAGGRSDDLGAVAQAALFDEEAGVRAQAASVLGMIRDADSIQPLADLLHDEEGLVLQAAARALVRIGQEHLESKGRVARHLVDALERLPKPRGRYVMAELQTLADSDLGSDVEPWREWAYRMP